MNGPRVNAKPITQPEAEELAASTDELMNRLSDEEFTGRIRLARPVLDAMTRVESALTAATGLSLEQRVERCR